ncbi:dihydroxyacetone kinase subunit DhaK [Actinoplanes subtropicus]|uniref:dihydroxyacetone kinase subunit DhaK n=1 Tax=Actinoplanes subtropicus TaxID=543632 RepID=UPI0004C3E587|nr:dihydroxyacetone kinase subunit DhaK [Actinoplanes subtropicus]
MSTEATVNDDVAVQDSLYTVGRRGVAGNFFIIKAVGAAAERGAELDELLRIGRKVNDVTRTRSPSGCSSGFRSKT